MLKLHTPKKIPFSIPSTHKSMNVTYILTIKTTCTKHKCMGLSEQNSNPCISLTTHKLHIFS